MIEAPRCPRCGRSAVERSLSPTGDSMAEIGAAGGGCCPVCGAFDPTMTLRLFDPAPGDVTTRESFGANLLPIAPPPARADLARSLVGTDFAGYRIDRFLGRGGMAWVFAATHGQLHRPCAVKVLCPDLKQRDPGAADAFLDEARAAASIVHPHVVTVHNIGQERELPFIELEYVPGEPLSAWFERGPVEPLTAVEFLADATAGLAAAHRQGMVHRDFKPSNILVAQRRLAKLADFGLAKRLGDRSGGLAGTPAFMAPELFRGEAPTPRSDIYAVGISLVELLAGEPLFRSTDWTEIARMHLNADWERMAERFASIDRAVLDVALRCVASDPRERFAEGDELAEALARCRRLLRPLGRMATIAYRDLDIDWVDHGDRLAVNVRLPSGRQQRLTVDRSECDRHGTSLVRIFSVCAPTIASYFERALETNARLAHGALAIQTIDGQRQFVMIDTYPSATCDAEELRQSTLQIAAAADEIEQLLTGEDRR